jgi:hypothetical protein
MNIIGFLIITLILLLLWFLTYQKKLQVGGSINERVVHYGDSVTFWSHKQNYMRMNERGFMDSTGSLKNPQSIPRNWVWEHFVLEPADEANNRWRSGARTPVRYGDKLRLRNWNMTISEPSPSNQRIGMNRNFSRNQIITIENVDPSGRQGQNIAFGDTLYLKSAQGLYFIQPQNSSMVEHKLKTPDYTAVWHIFDEYGQGQEMEWATRGMASQSSNRGDLPATNAIDGQDTTYSQTMEEANPWIQVELPHDIKVMRIVLKNKKGQHHDVLLAKSNVNLFDSHGTSVWNTHISDNRETYEFVGLAHVARSVKIQAQGTGSLSLVKVEVYGSLVDQSYTPVSSILMNQGSASSKTIIFNDRLPSVGDNGMSLSLFYRPSTEGFPSGTLVSRGKNFQLDLDKGVPSVNISTDQDLMTIRSNNQLVPGIWNHLAVIIKPRLGHGWEHGIFPIPPKGISAQSESSYLVNPQKRQFYQLNNSSDPSMESLLKLQKTEWSSDYVKDMEYLGTLEKNNTSITISLNGQNQVTDLDANRDVVLSDRSLEIGNDGLTGDLQLVKYFNYAIRNHDLAREGQSHHSRIQVSLISSRGLQDGYVIPAHMLPAPSKSGQMSFSFWLHVNKGKNETQTLGCSILGLQLQVRGGQIMLNGEESKLRTDMWYHITLSLSQQNTTVFINGQKAGSQEEIKLVVGDKRGPHGEVKDIKYFNYALEQEEISGVMGVHPERGIHTVIDELWRLQGCANSLVQHGEEDLIRKLTIMSRSGQKDQVREELKTIHMRAQEGDPVALNLCYGEQGAKLLSKLHKSEKLLKHTLAEPHEQKQPLPVAPFTCKNNKVGDFDIRTHPQFYKYVLAKDVRPPQRYPELENQLMRVKKVLSQVLDQDTINNILDEKSGNGQTTPAMRKAIDKMRQMNNVDNISQHPEYQKLINKLNQHKNGSASDVTSLEIQLNRCKALLKPKTTANETEIKKLHKQVSQNLQQGDRVQKIMAKGILQDSTERQLESDPKLKKIVDEAQKRGLNTDNNSQYRQTLLNVLDKQLHSSDTTRQAVHYSLKDQKLLRELTNQQSECLAQFGYV